MAHLYLSGISYLSVYIDLWPWPDPTERGLLQLHKAPQTGQFWGLTSPVSASEIRARTAPEQTLCWTPCQSTHRQAGSTGDLLSPPGHWHRQTTAGRPRSAQHLRQKSPRCCWPLHWKTLPAGRGRWYSRPARLTMPPGPPRCCDGSVRVIPQPVGNLGERLQAVDRVVRGRQPGACHLHGSDAPVLSESDYSAARSALLHHDVVLAPALDGGVTLMGARCPWPELADLPWSSDQLYAALTERCTGHGLRVTSLACELRRGCRGRPATALHRPAHATSGPHARSCTGGFAVWDTPPPEPAAAQRS